MIIHSEAATQRFLKLREEANYPALHLLPGEAEFLKNSAGIEYVANNSQTTLAQHVELGIKLAGLCFHTDNKIFSFDFRAGLTLLGQFFLLARDEATVCWILNHEHLHFQMQGASKLRLPAITDTMINPVLKG